MPHDHAYLLAEKKIEEALRSGATELYLTGTYGTYLDGPKLIELPESLAKLNQLRSLHLAFNHLVKLPEWLARFTELQVLNLADDALETIPEWLGQLKKCKF